MKASPTNATALARVVSQDGVQGTVESATVDHQGRMRLRLHSGRQVWVPGELLQPQSDGTYLLPLHLASFNDVAGGAGESEIVIVPVVAEAVEVDKRTVQQTVRVTKQVREQEQWVDEAGFQEDVDIERIAVNRVLDEPVQVRHEGDTVIVPLLEEVLVVEKRLVLKEELRITKRRTETRNPQRVVLRKEEATVEHLDTDTLSPTESGYPANNRA